MEHATMDDALAAHTLSLVSSEPVPERWGKIMLDILRMPIERDQLDRGSYRVAGMRFAIVTRISGVIEKAR